MPLKIPEKKSQPKKSSLFTQGYSKVRDKVSKGSKFTMSCFNCDFFYQTKYDDCEVCQNPQVLKYDMVVTDTTIYCNQWVISHREVSVKSMFKKEKRREKYVDKS